MTDYLLLRSWRRTVFSSSQLYILKEVIQYNSLNLFEIIQFENFLI